MNITKHDKMLMSKLMMVLLFSCSLISSVVMAEEEAAIPADTPDKNVELMQQAADGEVVTPRVRKFVKPNRMQMKASVVNSKVGYAFLDENQHKPGVIKLKSGLQYKVIKAGSGAKSRDEDIVQCQYRGTLIDGTVFEESSAGKAANIKVAPLMPGLKEAIKLMPVGSKWEVYIPAELGFGSAGKPPKVGPDAVLLYNLELLGITSPAINKP